MLKLEFGVYLEGSSYVEAMTCILIDILTVYQDDT